MISPVQGVWLRVLKVIILREKCCPPPAPTHPTPSFSQSL